MPYYNDGKFTYMDDYGQARADGGINQLDGKDPGWHTVSTFEDGGQFGSISTTTKVATGFLIFSGQDLEVQQVDSNAVKVDANGVPYAGKDTAEYPTGPPDKPWWDVDSDSMMPKPMENLPPGSIQPNLEYNQAALGANTLIVQGRAGARRIARTGPARPAAVVCQLPGERRRTRAGGGADIHRGQG